MKKNEIVEKILGARSRKPESKTGKAFAPVNIALCKYWGKRDESINLPRTSSLSISLPPLGAHTSVSPTFATEDDLTINGEQIATQSPAFLRVKEYLNMFRPDKNTGFKVESESNIALAAGLASSAAGFAALAEAVDNLYSWNLSDRELSILSRLGSGSACRSIYNGFVEWVAGESSDGMDSYAKPIEAVWPDLRISIVSISSEPKPISSREAMARTTETSLLYGNWPQRVDEDMASLKRAIIEKDFHLLGETAERNALAMHATMLDSRPPVLFWRPQTVGIIQKVWNLRNAGADLYFTIDAGPNVKLIHTANTVELLQAEFQPTETIAPFAT